MANELQRIAKPLFGVQQDRAAFQSRAIPTRLGEPAVGKLLEFPTPFVLRESARQIALAQTVRAQIEAGIGRQRIAAQGLLVARHGFGQLSPGLERRPQVVMRFGRIGLNRQCSLNARDRFGILARVAQRGSEIQMGVRVMWVDRDRRASISMASSIRPRSRTRAPRLISALRYMGRERSASR